MSAETPQPQHGAAPAPTPAPTLARARRLAAWFFRTPLLPSLRRAHSAHSAHSAPAAPAARSVDELLASSDLPQALSQRVKETVRCTRLRRREQVELAAELAAHVRDGVANGASETTLLERFGDAAAMAPLLRRGTIAKRSPVDRGATLAIKSLFISAAVVALLYLVAAVRLWTLQPTITFDPIARLDGLRPPAGHSAAWPLYKDALRWQKQLQAARSAELGALAAEPGAALLAAAASPPGTAATAKAPLATRTEDAAALRAHQHELSLLRDAAARPALGVHTTTELDPEDVAFATLDIGAGPPSASTRSAPRSPFPVLEIRNLQWSELFRAAHLLAADAQLALDDGDSSRAAANFAAILGVAGHLEEGRLLITQFGASHLRQFAATQLLRSLEQRPHAFDDSALRQLAELLARLPSSTYELDLAAERIAFEDAVQRLYSDDGEGDGVLLPRSAELLAELSASLPTHEADRSDAPVGSQLRDALAFATAPAEAVVGRGRRAVLEDHARLVDAVEAESRTPIWTPGWGDRVAAIENELFNSKEARALGARDVLRVLTGAVSHAATGRAMTRPWIDAAVTAVALERYRRAHGSWPQTLNSLVPEFLAEVPRDPFDGASLRYALHNGAPRLWSIGNDRSDEGGKVAVGPDGRPDSSPVSRWRRPLPTTGFVDPRTGRFIARPLPPLGDWLLWSPPGPD